MIKYRKGNLLDVTEGIILHGCNAQGVMGSGVALAVKQKYPEAYYDYKLEYEQRQNRLYLGQIIWSTDLHNKPDLMLGNAIVQENYGRDKKRYVNYAALATVFTAAISKARCYSCTLNFPKIGAGLGGGDWNIIEQIINDCDPKDEVTKICWEFKV